MKNKLSLLLFSTLLFCFQGTLQAQDIPTLSAGVGMSDRADHPEYSLKLVFFERGGPFLAFMEVEISDKNNNVLLSASSFGPWLFVDLPTGSYKVSATRKNGDKQGARFSIKSRRQKEIALEFPVN